MAAESQQLMLVKEGHLQLQTTDAAGLSNNATRECLLRSGWIHSKSVFDKDIDLVLKVPSEHFEALLIAVKALLEQDDRGALKEERVSTQDVTADYVDLKGRHAALSTVHEQLTKLMGRAQKVDEVLSVQRELSANLQKKEAMEAKMKAWERMSAYSTLHLHIHELPPPMPAPRPLRPQWAAMEAAQDAVHQWVDLLDAASAALVHFALFLAPAALLGAAFLAGLVWLLNRAAGALNRSLALQPDSVLFQLQNAPAAAEKKIDSMA